MRQLLQAWCVERNVTMTQETFEALVGIVEVEREAAVLSDRARIAELERERDRYEPKLATLRKRAGEQDRKISCLRGEVTYWKLLPPGSSAEMQVTRAERDLAELKGLHLLDENGIKEYTDRAEKAEAERDALRALFEPCGCKFERFCRRCHGSGFVLACEPAHVRAALTGQGEVR